MKTFKVQLERTRRDTVVIHVDADDAQSAAACVQNAFDLGELSLAFGFDNVKREEWGRTVTLRGERAKAAAPAVRRLIAQADAA